AVNLFHNIAVDSIAGAGTIASAYEAVCRSSHATTSHPPRLDSGRGRTTVHVALQRLAVPGPDGPSPVLEPQRRPGELAAQHQDRRLSRGLRLLPAERAP